MKDNALFFIGMHSWFIINGYIAKSIANSCTISNLAYTKDQGANNIITIIIQTNFMRGGLGGSAGADTSLLGEGAVLGI